MPRIVNFLDDITKPVARLVLALVVVCAFAVPGESSVAHACSCPISAAAAATTSAPADDTADEDFEVEPAGAEEGLGWGSALAGAALVAVLVLGLLAVKRQREQGRRSKFPPIG